MKIGRDLPVQIVLVISEYLICLLDWPYLHSFVKTFVQRVSRWTHFGVLRYGNLGTIMDGFTLEEHLIFD